jgi:AcrR family transcriptional regulator
MNMARPVDANAEVTRKKLLAAATERFTRHGWEGTSLRAVADDAGLSLATIHHYFGNKDDLFRAAADATSKGLAREATPLLELLDRLAEQARSLTPEGSRAALGQLVREAYRFAREHRFLLQLLFRPLVERGELDARWRDRALVPFLDRASAALEASLRRPAHTFRLPLQSLVALLMRYALSNDRELAQLVGVGPTSRRVSAAMVRRARGQVESYLVLLAEHLLLDSVIDYDGYAQPRFS